MFLRSFTADIMAFGKCQVKVSYYCTYNTEKLEHWRLREPRRMRLTSVSKCFPERYFPVTRTFQGDLFGCPMICLEGLLFTRNIILVFGF